MLPIRGASTAVSQSLIDVLGVSLEHTSGPQSTSWSRGTLGCDVVSATGAEDSRSTCSPCRGTGKLVSALGGEPHEVTCPWCGGTGRFESGRDAQADVVTEHP